jgi:hypothetical protein
MTPSRYQSTRLRESIGLGVSTGFTQAIGTYQRLHLGFGRPQTIHSLGRIRIAVSFCMKSHVRKPRWNSRLRGAGSTLSSLPLHRSRGPFSQTQNIQALCQLNNHTTQGDIWIGGLAVHLNDPTFGEQGYQFDGLITVRLPATHS